MDRRPAPSAKSISPRRSLTWRRSTARVPAIWSSSTIPNMPISWRRRAPPPAWSPSAMPIARRKASRRWWSREPYRACAIVAARIYPEAARPGSWFDSARRFARRQCSSFGAAGGRRHRRSRRGDRASCGNRRGRGDRPQCGDRPERAHRPQQRRSAPARRSATRLIGDRVIIHPGARIGQDGFGFAMGPRGHLKVPQIGRVDHPGRCRDRRQYHHRSRRQSRHDHRRGDQDR